MSERWTGATGICQRICKAHVFDVTFGVNSAFNAEVFVAPPHAVAMEFDLFGERRSSHWVKDGGGQYRERLSPLLWERLGEGAKNLNRTIEGLTPVWVPPW